MRELIQNKDAYLETIVRNRISNISQIELPSFFHETRRTILYATVLDFLSQ